MRKIITFIIFLLLYLFAPQDARSQSTDNSPNVIVDNTLPNKFSLLIKGSNGDSQRFRFYEGVGVYDVRLSRAILATGKIEIILEVGNNKKSTFVHVNKDSIIHIRVSSHTFYSMVEVK